MNRSLHRWGAVICLGIAPMAAGAPESEDESPIETVRVFAERQSQFDSAAITSDRARHGAADSARLLATLPGADVNDNGSISGQLQYRGLFGPRLDVQVNGMAIPVGGPNWMDPPMHYVPRGLLHSARVSRGIADVSRSGIGGAASARWKRPAFNREPGWQPSVDVDSSWRSVDDGHELAGTFGLASDRHRVHVAGSDESADDYSAGDGEVAGTSFSRSAYGAGYGFQGDHQAFELGYHRIDTDDAGTPSLPLDIQLFDTNLWHGRYRFSRGDNVVTVRLGGSDIEHVMDNFSVRPPPDVSSLPLPPFAGTDRRYVDAASDSLEAGLTFSTFLGDGVWESGAEWLTESHDATVFDPDFEPFFVTNFDGSEQDRGALFSQWEGPVTEATRLELGARYARVVSETGTVDAFPARLVDMDPALWPMGTPPRAVWLLRERFNAADRSRTDHLVDWVAGLSTTFTPGLTGELGLARKSRAPVYQERFLWIPLEVNAGLGDGNNYVGSLDLDPEVSHQVEAGLEWASDRAYLTPRAYYRRIDDYIQGVASDDPVVTAVSANANGDPTPLEFANVDAEIYGFDVGFGVRLTQSLRLDGNAAYVRGKRRDVNDDLYRISPPNLRIGLTWQRQSLRLKLEQVLVAEQDHLSATLTDDPTNPNNRFEAVDGYTLTNLYGSYDFGNGLRLDLGLENVFDEHYTDPLSGFNRNVGGAVAVGQRLPGRGVNVFGRLWYRRN